MDGIERCIDDELPFEVPDSWELIRLNDVGIYRKGPFGSSLTKSMFVPKGANSIKVYEQKNAIQKDASLGEYYITKEYYEEKMQSFTVQPGDIIVSCAGTIGETYVLPNDIEVGIINQALMRMSIYAPIDIDYFLLYFDYVLKESARNSSKGSAIKNIPPFVIFKQMLLPLPPVAEQRRIVESVNFINSIIESLR
ncbi:restriction endonuclease subunit S [Coprococcus eutactus]|uniref:restriction endonuclease subunit S n=1 Tax=Coprococcus eutactus TaxID=33043 RepID=UPI001C029178|nr:restriction endonuclease subunit S [Coprococcus eutactus]